MIARFKIGNSTSALHWFPWRPFVASPNIDRIYVSVPQPGNLTISFLLTSLTKAACPRIRKRRQEAAKVSVSRAPLHCRTRRGGRDPNIMQRVTVKAAATAAAAALQIPGTKNLATKSFSISVAQILDGRARQYEHIAAHAPVLDAVERMSVNAVGSLIVLNNGCMEGIVTERDVLSNIPRIMQQEKPLTVDYIMTRNPVTVDASATVGECMAIMSHNNFRHLPVTDEGELVGVLSIRDLVDQVAKDHHDEVSELQGQLQKLTSILGTEMTRGGSSGTWPLRLREWFLPRSAPNMS